MARRNPYTDPQGDHGGRSESRVVRGMGGRTTPASGALTGCKSDGTVDAPAQALRIESKATVNDSIGLKKAWLDKITHEALETNRQPALVVSFVQPDGTPRPHGDWAVVPLWLLKELLGGSLE